MDAYAGKMETHERDHQKNWKSFGCSVCNWGWRTWHFKMFLSLLVSSGCKARDMLQLLVGKKECHFKITPGLELELERCWRLTPVWGHFPLFLSTCVSLLPVFPHLPEVTDILALASLLPNSFLHYFLIHHVKVGKLMDPVSIPVFFVSCWPVYGLTALGLYRWGKKSGSIWWKTCVPKGMPPQGMRTIQGPLEKTGQTGQNVPWHQTVCLNCVDEMHSHITKSKRKTTKL